MRHAPWSRLLLATVLVLLALFAARADETTVAAQQPERLALVIGNAAYPGRTLPTATNDAGLLAETLAREGFEVTAGADTDRATLRQLTDGFIDKAKSAGSGSVFVVYFAGYGLQVDGENYFAPVDARIAHDADVSQAALRLNDLMKALDAVPARARLTILDLAHDTPFAHDGVPIAGGLALVAAAPNSLVAFNTAPGTVAAATGATYGAYARTLSTLIDASGLPANTLFEQLRLRVAALSDAAAVPWTTSQLDPDFRLGPAHKDAVAIFTAPGGPVSGLPPDAAVYATLARDTLADYDGFLMAFRDDPLVDRIRAMAAVRREATIFALAVSANMPAVYWTYMRRYPHGPHLYDVRRRLALVHAQLEPPPRFDVWTFPNTGLPTPAELAILAERPVELREAGAAALPAPPAGLLAPSLPDTADLSVPPLPVTGALPLPMPARLARSGTVGTIRQPFVPGYGELIATIRSSDSGAPEIVISRGESLLSRTNAESQPGKRIVTQRDAAGAVISRSVTTTAADVATTVQTGPTGGILKKVVTRADANGAQTTTVSNGANKVIATIDRDKNGVVVAAKQATGPTPRDATLVFEPDGTKPPRIEPAEAAAAQRAPVAQAPAAAPVPPAPAPTTSPTAPHELKVEAPPPPPPAPPAAPAPAPVPTPAAAPARAKAAARLPQRSHGAAGASHRLSKLKAAVAPRAAARAPKSARASARRARTPVRARHR